MGFEQPWERLHPLSLLVNLGPRAFVVLRGSWPLIVALFVGNAGRGVWADLSILFVFAALTVTSTVVHFFTLRYRVANGRLEIQSGVLMRKVRIIDAKRIQNVELARNVFHRVVGLVEVKVETASGREVEGLLSALTEPAAERLMKALRADMTHSVEAPVEDVLLAIGPAELLAYGTTVSRWGFALAVVAAGAELLPIVDPVRLSGLLGPQAIAAALVAATTGAWVLGVGGALVRHWGFRLVRRGDVLVAEGGLFTRRQVQIRRRKLQQIQIVETPIARWAGFVTIQLDTAAAGGDPEGGAQSEVVLPFVHRAQAAALIRIFHADLDLDVTVAALAPPHPSALTRARLAGIWQAALAVAGLVWWFGPWGLLGALLVPVLWIGASLEHRTSGWWIGDGFVVSRLGWWRRVMSIGERRKVQSADVVQGLLMRRWGLARLVVRLAGVLLVLPDLALERVESLHEGVLPPPARVKPAR